MKVILYVAATINGYIARENDDSDFISGEAWEEYLLTVKKIGNVIMGRRTFEVCVKEQNNFPFPNALNIVMTKRKIKNSWPRKVIFTPKSPKQVLKLLEQGGFDSAFLAGGSKINASFIKKDLVDEVYIDIIPLILGRGIKLFKDSDFESRLKLIDIKKVGSVVRLHYKVL